MHSAAMVVFGKRPLRKKEGRLESGFARSRGTVEVPCNLEVPCKGMTLIEICIALGIAAGLLAIAVPAISSVTRAHMRQKSGQLAGGLRSLYGAAALHSATCRLVIDLDENSYESECAKGTIRLSGEGERARNGKREESKEEELLANTKGRESLSERDKAKLELLQKAAFAPTTDIPKTKLGSDVKFLSVWVEHQPERYTAGKAFLYYWPSGVAENASIQLEQGDGVITLLVSPLTGRVQMFNGAKDAPGEKP